MSILAAIALSPALLAVAIAIRLEDGKPVIYRQLRLGRSGQPFTLLKFRSMPVGTPDLASNAARALAFTKVGGWIRRLSIDEAPQLMNIVRGDMSLVGPRPALPQQVHLIRARRMNGAFEVRPGLTGLAQVNSYDNMPEEEKAMLDSIYAQKITFRQDLEILARTVVYLRRPPPTY